MMAIRRNSDATGLIAKLKPFKNRNSTFTGKAFDPGHSLYSPGERVSDPTAIYHSCYVVYSHGSPIGWYINGAGWVIPAQTLPASGNQHQHYLRRGAEK